MRQSRRAEAEAAAAKTKRNKTFRNYGIILGAFVALVAVIALVNRGGDDDTTTTTASTTTGSTTTLPVAPTDCPPETGSTTRFLRFSAAPKLCIDPAKKHTAVFDTSEGTMRFELDTAKVPNTVNNFVVLARYGYYDGTRIFRTDPSIDIVQGGSPSTNSASDPGPGYNIKDEGGTFDFSASGKGPFTYAPGQLVMARSSGPDSSGAQYFITTGDKVKGLDGQGTYIVFGRTDAAGLEVAKKIIGLHQADNSGLGGKPSKNVTVNSVKIEVA